MVHDRVRVYLIYKHPTDAIHSYPFQWRISRRATLYSMLMPNSTNLHNSFIFCAGWAFLCLLHCLVETRSITEWNQQFSEPWLAPFP